MHQLPDPLPDYRERGIIKSRREALRAGVGLIAGGLLSGCAMRSKQTTNSRKEVPVFDIRKYGAVGDGVTLDTAAIQHAIDEASAAGKDARVLVPGGRRYLIGTLELKGSIDFHLADDAELLVSTKQSDYRQDAAILAHGAEGLRITGTGSINGRSPEFMTHFDEKDEWWRPAAFRPKLFVLTACNNLEMHDITIRQAPLWTVHLMGCEHVLIDRIKIRNQLDVPNCDGIDPDHCRDVEIRNCDIVCGDDAIVIKATRQGMAYGPSANIVVKDCKMETQDSGLKIGTETTQDIHDIRFERCDIKSCCRGICIQLRDEGSVYNIDFRDIKFTSRYHSDPWWGRGEAISFTAIPRSPRTKIGTIHDVRVTDLTCKSENSVRICGSAQSRVRGVKMDHVAVTMDRWTKYRGGLFDNRPTSAQPDIETRGNPGFSIEHADEIELTNCSVAWGTNRPDYFTNAVQANDTIGLKLTKFNGEAAHPERDKAILME